MYQSIVLLALLVGSMVVATMAVVNGIWAQQKLAQSMDENETDK